MAFLIYMDRKPTAAPINEDDNEPATKGQFRGLKVDVEGIDQRLIKIENKVDTLATKKDLKKLATKVDTLKDEIIREFKVVAENIHKDVAAANKDEISLIKNQNIPALEERVQDLEEHAGLSGFKVT